ncbi:MAG: mechanosensitive ion channel family protein, partial [Pseudomonadota bacterium]|nr:mechanosensitive ion channel family protein [Pseudomonadota bacterium]
ARVHAIDPATMAVEAKRDIQERFGVEPVDLEPRVFYRITDNWLELTVRFIVGTHLIRAAKDAMSRYIITEFDKAGIGIASATYDIVGFPAIELHSRHRRDAAGNVEKPKPAA